MQRTLISQMFVVVFHCSTMNILFDIVAYSCCSSLLAHLLIGPSIYHVLQK